MYEYVSAGEWFTCSFPVLSVPLYIYLSFQLPFLKYECARAQTHTHEPVDIVTAPDN